MAVRSWVQIPTPPSYTSCCASPSTAQLYNCNLLWIRMSAKFHERRLETLLITIIHLSNKMQKQPLVLSLIQPSSQRPRDLRLSLTICIIKKKRFLLRVHFRFRARNAMKPAALLACYPSCRLMLNLALGLFSLEHRRRLILIQRSVVHRGIQGQLHATHFIKDRKLFLNTYRIS